MHLVEIDLSGCEDQFDWNSLTQSDPELEIELIEGQKIGAPLKLHLVKTACAKESPLLTIRS